MNAEWNAGSFDHLAEQWRQLSMLTRYTLYIYRLKWYLNLFVCIMENQFTWACRWKHNIRRPDVWTRAKTIETMTLLILVFVLLYHMLAWWSSLKRALHWRCLVLLFSRSLFGFIYSVNLYIFFLQGCRFSSTKGLPLSSRSFVSL